MNGDSKLIKSISKEDVNLPGINGKLFTIELQENWMNNPPTYMQCLRSKYLKSKSMEKLNVQVFNKSTNPLPTYATPFSSGVDLLASVEENAKVIIYPGQRVIIKTGLHVAIPEGYEMQIRPRSGLAAKNGITVLNTPGTIDADYRGEIGVIIANFGGEAISISNGMKIAQGVIVPVYQLNWESVTKLEDLPSSERGQGGFGSTGNEVKPV